MNTPVTVTAEDMKRIGHTTYGKGGLTRFVCSPETSNVEAILLRSILDITGHTILQEEDFPWCIEGQPEHHCDIEFVTNYPWDLYKERF
jgi:hypothetical protein